MAVPSIDPLTLTNWEDAFQQPVVNVRAMERQLRGSLDANKEKLRALVGESYRDLLGTAERIIEMDTSIRKVETHLAETTKNCNYRRLEKKASNLKEFKGRISASDRQKFIFASQLAILQNCPMTISRLITKNETGLLPAKIYVIATLLLKSITQQAKTPITETIRKQLASLRTILLRHIDMQLRDIKLNIPELTDALKAFSLVTSSSSLDVLIHFQTQRLNAISSILNHEKPDMDVIINSFKILHSTLQDTTEIFPRRLSDALAKLKSQALFFDPAVKGLTELNFDMHERWVPEDIRRYTRWVRHDDLDIKQVQTEMKTRTARVVTILFDNLQKALTQENDMHRLVILRKQVFALWRSNKSKMLSLNDHDGDAAGEKFRIILNDRLSEVLRQQAQDIKFVIDLVSSTFSIIQMDTENDFPFLWSSKTINHDLSNGGKSFLNILQGVTYGETPIVKAVQSSYQTWSHKVAYHFGALKIMTKIDNEWNPDDDDEEEDSLDIDTMKEDINKTDAKRLEKTQDEALIEAYQVYTSSISKIIDELEGSNDVLQNEKQAKFLLRILRFVKSKPPVFEKQEIVSLDNLGTNLFDRLHAILSDFAVRKPLARYLRFVKQKDWNKPVAFKKLWEGDPALPVQPSSSIFKLQYNIVKDMGGVGIDVWRDDAVQVLKQMCKKEIWNTMKPLLSELCTPDEAPDGSYTNGSTVLHVTNEVAEGNVNGKMNDSKDTIESDGTQTLAPNNDPSEESIKKGIVQSDDVGVSEEAKGASVEEFSLTGSTVSTIRKGMSHDNALQLLFDLAYLDSALRIKRPSVLEKSSSTIQNGDFDSSSRVELSWEFLEGNFVGGKGENWAKVSELEKERIFSSVDEYWRRTALLFGLLDV